MVLSWLLLRQAVPNTTRFLTIGRGRSSHDWSPCSSVVLWVETRSPKRTDTNRRASDRCHDRAGWIGITVPLRLHHPHRQIPLPSKAQVAGPWVDGLSHVEASLHLQREGPTACLESSATLWQVVGSKHRHVGIFD